MPVIPQGLIVQRPISANPGLNFTPGFYISLFKSCFRIILPIVFRAFNYQIVVNKLNLLLKLSGLKSNFTLILDYLNPALNNPAQVLMLTI